MEQGTLSEIMKQSDRFGIRCVAGSTEGVEVDGVEMLEMGELATATAGYLVIALHTGPDAPRAYQVDIAIRRAIAAEAAALVFTEEVALAETSRALADRGGLTVLVSRGSTSELAVFVDRLISRGAGEALSRAEHAIAEVGVAAEDSHGDATTAILAAASAALGTQLTLVADSSVRWTQSDAICIGEVPIGRLVAEQPDNAVALALPVVASVLSRALQRESQDRFGPARSRADLIVELIFADSSRIDGLAVDAVRTGLPVQLSHSVAWLTPTHRDDPGRRPPAMLSAAVELNTMQLVDGRAETWHFAGFHDDLVIVASEEFGAPDHQRRLRDVIERVVEHAREVAGDEWSFTVGLGTPQSGAIGLRQSATEAHIATETAIASGRFGAVEATDVTGLRRVLLDFYASPLSRTLLDDILAPLDALGQERAGISLRTLLAYVSHRNSLVRAAEVLNLHPNAVNYRIRRIEQTLGLDLGDPDVRFAVELACRVRLLTARG